MKPYIGFWDALFGKRITIEIPSPNGGEKKAKVTKKWFDQMQRTGQMKNVSPQMVKVNILDPMSGLSSKNFDDPTDFLDVLAEHRSDYRIEYWKIGERVPREQHDQFLDPETKELLAITSYNNGNPSTFLVQRGLWEQTRERMRNV
jgi:hypothetical protein